MPSPFTYPVAGSVPFDNETNGFESTDVQAAIEEATTLGASLSRFQITCVMNTIVTNNDWITYSSFTPDARIRFPINAKLTEISWDNRRSGVSFDLEFYRYEADGTPYPVNPFYTYEARNIDYGDIAENLNYDFLKSDYIRILFKDKGWNPNDFVLNLWCYRTS
jgi:hypothetical protein